MKRTKKNKSVVNPWERGNNVAIKVLRNGAKSLERPNAKDHPIGWSFMLFLSF